MMDGLPHALPPLYPYIERQAVLQENQHAIRSQHTRDTTRNWLGGLQRAEREGADHRVHALVIQRNVFGPAAEDPDVDGCSASGRVGQAQHAGIGFQCVNAFYVGPIVQGGVCARPDANFEDRTASQRDDLFAKRQNRLRIPEAVDEAG